VASLKRLACIVEDLREIRNSGVVSADTAVRKIVAFLQECEADPDVLSWNRVIGDATVSDFDYNLDKYQELQGQGINAFRAKILDLTRVQLEYRIIYVHFERRDTYIVMAVLPRAIAYDADNPKTRRIVASYASLVADGWQ